LDLRDYIRALRFSADGRLVIVRGEQDGDKIWNVESGELEVKLPSFKDQPRPDVVCRRVLDIDEEGRMWAFAQQLKPAFMHNEMLVRYAPDATTFERIIPDLESHMSLYRTAILSPDRRLLAINTVAADAKDKHVPRIEIEIWDVAEGKRLKRYDGHYGRVTAMAFSPDGKRLASMGGPTGLVKIWEIEP
jgi:WD40 repeat protein